MKTITATVPAWISNHTATLKTLSEETQERAVSDLIFWAPHSDDSTGPETWVKVGTAEITVTFDSAEKIICTQIATLRAAKRKVQADCEVALNQLEGQIQSLLAIESK
jgi:hypothetical protein